jgi:hypothetical protein
MYAGGAGPVAKMTGGRSGAESLSARGRAGRAAE